MSIPIRAHPNVYKRASNTIMDARVPSSSDFSWEVSSFRPVPSYTLACFLGSFHLLNRDKATHELRLSYS